MRSRTSPPQSARAPQWQLLSPGHHNVLAQTEEPALSRCLQKELSLPHLVVPTGPGRLQSVDFHRGCPETHSSLRCLCLLAPHSLPWHCGALVSLWDARVCLWDASSDGHTLYEDPLSAHTDSHITWGDSPNSGGSRFLPLNGRHLPLNDFLLVSFSLQSPWFLMHIQYACKRETKNNMK